MSRNAKIIVLVVALIMLGALAASRFWPIQQPPTDSVDYLQRELERLQDADAEDLPASERNIKAGLSTESDTDELTTLFLNELARCHRETREAKGDRVPPLPPTPAGHNGWPELEKAGSYAETVEQAGYQLDSAPGYDAAGLLKASEVLPQYFDTLLTYDHITVPPTTDYSKVIPIPSAISRVLAMRVNALLATGDRASALGEATAGLRAFSKTDVGPALICLLLHELSWSVLFEYVVLKPAWTADELEQLIREIKPPTVRLDRLMLTEARYAQDGGLEPSIGEFQGWAMKQLLDDHGYLPLNDLIDASLEEAELALQTRLKVAAWAREHPGDVLEPGFFRQVIDQLPESERKLWIGHISDTGQSRALLAAARLKHAWLQGVRGTALAARADSLAAESGFLAASKTEDGYAFEFAAAHPAREFGRTEALADIALSE
jgi:hypothetical protein